MKSKINLATLLVLLNLYYLVSGGVTAAPTFTGDKYIELSEESLPLSENLALNKNAVQSSTYFSGGEARNAVDGNTDGAWGKGSVTHTGEGDDNPYWEVDLGQVSAIETITISPYRLLSGSASKV